MINLIVLFAVLLIILQILHKGLKLNHSNVVYMLAELLCAAALVFLLNKLLAWLLLLVLLTIFVMLTFGIRNDIFRKFSAEVWIINLVVLLLKYYKVFDAYSFVDRLLKF